MNALQQFLQSASNAAASNVSGPVDLIAAGLRKVGVPVPQNALMSSQWMADRGLTKPVPQNALSLAGEAFGLVAPIAAAAKAPQIAAGMNAVADDFQRYNQALGPAGASQATVWHGSPHKFDRFDSSKIGTGEGAQAYGHGLYLAESPDVAKSYQTALSSERGFSFGGKTGLTRDQVQDMVNAKYGTGYLDGVIRPSGVADSFIDDMVTGAARAQGSYPRQYKPGSERAKIYDELRGQITHADPGSLYKVDLPDTAIARMLDWDKPLSQQAPEVQKALQDSGLMQYADQYFKANKKLSPTAADLHDFLKYSGYSQSELASKMAERGLPGIRYLDGGSRGAGSGTSNYVIFPGEENMLTILERNGQPLR